jgi:hypothetical protein
MVVLGIVILMVVMVDVKQQMSSGLTLNLSLCPMLKDSLRTVAILLQKPSLLNHVVEQTGILCC